MLFIWNLNFFLLFIESKLVLFINCTFYSNLNLTNFFVEFKTQLNFLFKKIECKLFLLISFTFYCNLNSTHFHVIYVECKKLNFCLKNRL